MRLKPPRSTLVSVLFNCSCFVYQSHCVFRSPFVFCAAASCCFNSPTSPLGSIKISSYLFMTAERSVSICLFIHVFTLRSVNIFTLEELCSFNRMSKSSKSRSGASGEFTGFILQKGNTLKPPPLCSVLRTLYLPPPPSFLSGTEKQE